MHAEEPPSAPELDAVAVAAEQQLRALASEDPLDAGPLAEALAHAATAAIASGQPIAEYDLHQAVARTARLGLPQREIAARYRAARTAAVGASATAGWACLPFMTARRAAPPHALVRRLSDGMRV
jgi:hypothetical protein